MKNRMMGHSRSWVISMLWLAAISFFMTRPAFGQITEIREYRQKTIGCTFSGLRRFEIPCGLSGGSKYIFIGSVLLTTDVENNEKLLWLIPTEVFLGTPAYILTVTARNGGCLPEIHTGDRWLFYLAEDESSHKLFLPNISPSGPIVKNPESIARLRRLTKMADSGVIIVSAQKPMWRDDGTRLEDAPVPNHKVIAKRMPEGDEYKAFTGGDGGYELELPAGSYHLTANTAQGLLAEEGSIDVGPRSCGYIQFELRPDGRISGHIRSADGKPLELVQRWVDVVSEAPGDSRRVFADQSGYFEARGLRPGRYMVGIGIASYPGSAQWRSRIYYPGVTTQRSAGVIDLGDAENRTHIDFQVPLPQSEKQDQD